MLAPYGLSLGVRGWDVQEEKLQEEEEEEEEEEGCESWKQPGLRCGVEAGCVEVSRSCQPGLGHSIPLTVIANQPRRRWPADGGEG